MYHLSTITKIWQKYLAKFKNIIKYNIPETPPNVGVFGSITFSHTPEEAMSGGLVKACVPSKILFCCREIELSNEY